MTPDSWLALAAAIIALLALLAVAGLVLAMAREFEEAATELRRLTRLAGELERQSAARGDQV